MKHASAVALDALEPLLANLRRIEGLTERKRGVFYRHSKAFLHFHEDPAGFFADMRLDHGWARFDVTTPAQRRRLVTEARAAVTTPASRAARG